MPSHNDVSVRYQVAVIFLSSSPSQGLVAEWPASVLGAGVRKDVGVEIPRGHYLSAAMKRTRSHRKEGSRP